MPTIEPTCGLSVSIRNPRGTCVCGRKNDWLCICQHLGFSGGSSPPHTHSFCWLLLLCVVFFVFFDQQHCCIFSFVSLLLASGCFLCKASCFKKKVTRRQEEEEEEEEEEQQEEGKHLNHFNEQERGK